MIRYLGNEDSENGSKPIFEAEICIKVLGNKSGYLKGLGIVMPQKTSSSTSNLILMISPVFPSNFSLFIETETKR